MSIPLRLSLKAAGVLVLFGTLYPHADLHAQQVRVGGGAFMAEALTPEAAFHAQIDATADLNSILGLRLGGFVGTGGRLAGNSPALGASLAMLAGWPEGSAVRPYLGFGLSFTKTDESAYKPLAHDLGFALPIGVEFGNGWFLEINQLFFGNMFYTPDITEWVTLATVGMRVR